jgi:hypothetical protein
MMILKPHGDNNQCVVGGALSEMEAKKKKPPIFIGGPDTLAFWMAMKKHP